MLCEIAFFLAFFFMLPTHVCTIHFHSSNNNYVCFARLMYIWFVTMAPREHTNSRASRNRPFIHWFRFYMSLEHFRALQRTSHEEVGQTRIQMEIITAYTCHADTYKIELVIPEAMCWFHFISFHHVSEISWRQWVNTTERAKATKKKVDVQVINLAYLQGAWQH